MKAAAPLAHIQSYYSYLEPLQRIADGKLHIPPKLTREEQIGHWHQHVKHCRHCRVCCSSFSAIVSCSIQLQSFVTICARLKLLIVGKPLQTRFKPIPWGLRLLGVASWNPSVVMVMKRMVCTAHIIMIPLLPLQAGMRTVRSLTLAATVAAVLLGFSAVADGFGVYAGFGWTWMLAAKVAAAGVAAWAGAGLKKYQQQFFFVDYDHRRIP